MRVWPLRSGSTGFSMWLFAALAGLACLLAIVGIYSVVAYGVRGRAQETRPHGAGGKRRIATRV